MVIGQLFLGDEAVTTASDNRVLLEFAGGFVNVAAKQIVGLGIIVAVIDGFRPTSKFTARFIEKRLHWKLFK